MVSRFVALQERRQRRVDLEGSPSFPHRFGVIAATTGRENLDLRAIFPLARKYEPLTSVRLVNNSSVDLQIFINGVDFDLLPAGVITTITDEPMWSFELRNTTAAATVAAEVRANFSRPPLGADEAARRAV